MHKTYVILSIDQLPLALKERSHPHVIDDVHILFTEDRNKVIGPDGEVLQSGVIEFSTKITAPELVKVCDPKEEWSEDFIDDEKFRCTIDNRVQREGLVKDTLESMKTDLRANKFDCGTLTWNLRAGNVLWVYVEKDHQLRVYEGVATRPDTNHRTNVIVDVHMEAKKHMRLTSAASYLQYNPSREYSLVIYTDDFDGEAGKFYKWNTMGKKAAPGKAFSVSSLTKDGDLFAKTAHAWVYRSGILGDKNVEIPSTTLSKNSAKMVLFYTLIRGLKSAFPNPPETDDERETLVQYLSDFTAHLSKALPNRIALLSLAERQRCRAETIADQAITWVAYCHLAAELRGRADWKEVVAKLAEPHTEGSFTGALLDRTNPLWVAKGILAPGGKTDGLKVVSNRQSQANLIATLKSVVLGGLPALVV